MKGIIFQVDHESWEEGEGIRQVIYIKGCPMKCLWCCSPEGLNVPVEPNLAPLPNQTSKWGWEIDSHALIVNALRQKVFFDASHGGITLTGGDPLAQPEFALAIMREAHENKISCAVATSGYTAHLTGGAAVAGMQLMMEADFLLYDFKVFDRDLHQRFTECSNDTIKENLEFLSEMGKRIIIRTPIIPHHNDDEYNITNEMDFLLHLKHAPEYIDLLPYHDYGSQKYPQVGKIYPLADLTPPSHEKMLDIAGRFARQGLQVRIGGIDPVFPKEETNLQYDDRLPSLYRGIK